MIGHWGSTLVLVSSPILIAISRTDWASDLSRERQRWCSSQFFDGLLPVSVNVRPGLSQRATARSPIHKSIGPSHRTVTRRSWTESRQRLVTAECEAMTVPAELRATDEAEPVVDRPMTGSVEALNGWTFCGRRTGSADSSGRRGPEPAPWQGEGRVSESRFPLSNRLVACSVADHRREIALRDGGAAVVTSLFRRVPQCESASSSSPRSR